MKRSLRITALIAWICISCAGSMHMLTLRIGEDATLPCHQTGSAVEWKAETSGTRGMELFSSLKGETKTLNSNYSTRISLTSDGSLVLSSLKWFDQGLYQCSTASGSQTPTRIIYLHTYQPPTKPEITMIRNHVKVDDSAEMICTSEDGYPAGNLTWYKNGRILEGTEEDVSIKNFIILDQKTQLSSMKSVLSYTPREVEEELSFRCHITYDITDPISIQESDERTLELIHPLKHITLLLNSGFDDVREGDKVTLKCKTDARPLPSFVWTKDAVYLDVKNDTIVFPSITKRDAGDYKCVATDEEFTELSGSISFTVGEKRQETRIIKIANLDSYEEIQPESSVSSSVNRSGMIIGVLGALILVAFILAAVYWLCYHQKKSQGSKEENVVLNGVEAGNADFAEDKNCTKEYLGEK
ncbi:advanced glycosylation end product-specific receptor-like [Polypterus senegalus]|uniref:advanced glycosylation end product-specific receptor-like n=1 Tax=Polypterus senegalus TaxID=55291 RepID=UPI001962F150|nr:advanced glycosylation end product-specific receptor-like [Polypterus senegalus]